MTKRRVLLYLIIWVLAFLLLSFAVVQCPAAKSAPLDELSPEEQARWINGRDCYHQMLDGIPRDCHWDTAFEDMLLYHGERWDNAVYEFSRGFFGQTSPLVGWGRYVVARCVSAGIDFRHTVPALHLESTYGMGSRNYFGILCYRVPSDFAGQLEVFIRIIQEGTAQRGNDPAALAGYYNCNSAPYMRNWSQLFWGVR